MSRPLRQFPAILFGFALGSITATAIAANPAPRDAVSMLLLQAQDEIHALSTLARAVPDPNVRGRLMFRSDRAEAAIDQALLQAGQIGRPQGPPPVVIRVTAEPEMQSMLSAIAAAPFSDDKLAILGSATAGRAFTVAQVGRFIDAMTFSDEQVQAGIMLYPQVVDPQNWYTIYAHLTFSSDREELAAATDRR